MPRPSCIQYRCPSWTTGEETLDPFGPVHSRFVLVTSPRPPARTATAATPERPPVDQTVPSCATALAAMYQALSLPQLHSDAPVAGSKPRTLRGTATTSSCLPPRRGASRGVFHASRMPLARHTSLPVLRSRATRLSLSTLALTISR